MVPLNPEGRTPFFFLKFADFYTSTHTQTQARRRPCADTNKHRLRATSPWKLVTTSSLRAQASKWIRASLLQSLNVYIYCSHHVAAAAAAGARCVPQTLCASTLIDSTHMQLINVITHPPTMASNTARSHCLHFINCN